MNQIHILHENPAWLPPLEAALSRLGLRHTSWHLDQGTIDLDRAPPDGIFYNRMSASSHTRGHRYGPEYASAVIAWLERHGRKVVNGGRAIDLEISKVRQYNALAAAGVRIPHTRVAVGREAILEAARGFNTPFIVKPNRGGKGLGVVRFESREELAAYIDSPGFHPGPDGTVLIQQYIVSPVPYIVRTEFVGGRFLYAVRVDTSRGFDLCPADDTCASDARPRPAAERGRFTVLDDFFDPNRLRFARALAVNDINIAGIEVVYDEFGDAYAYDLNTNTNYNAAAEAAAGIEHTPRAGMMAIATYLSELLAEHYPQLHAASA